MFEPIFFYASINEENDDFLAKPFSSSSLSLLMILMVSVTESHIANIIDPGLAVL